MENAATEKEKKEENCLRRNTSLFEALMMMMTYNKNLRIKKRSEGGEGPEDT